MNYNQPAYTPYAPYPQYNQNYQQTPSTVCRPVTSKEEAIGVPVDFMGSLMVFPDLGHGKVYVKRFNAQTGSADFMEFSDDQQQSKENVDFSGSINLLSAKVDLLSQKIDKMMEGYDGQSVADSN